MPTPRRAALLLLILTALLYAPTLRYDWVYEDQNDLETFFSSERTAGNRWVTVGTYRLSHAISGVQPWGYHLVSVAEHLGNGALLGTLLPATGAGVVGLALFLFHPLQVESVAYVSNRADVVMTTCLLLALIGARHRQWAMVLIAAVGCVLAKESGVMALPLVAWFVWRRGQWPRSAWVGLLATALMAGWAIGRWMPTIDLGWTVTEVTKTLWYLTRLLWPFGLSIEQDWTWITPQIALIGTVLAIGMAWRCRRSVVAWPMGFVVLALLPRLGIPLYEGLHAHHFYLPMVGISLGVGWMTQKVSYESDPLL
ncbi:MAG: hypothetical protein RLY20_1272 [Verrucomicrobiota bacterium]|jgi:hypothetical protein